ncbi:hypothetical protein OPV22_024998 [Ensete ventricosum]|uniref:DEAD/DEAH-box helicase domain-containing protein n=1 Tax=Ensete ventricosum TaxID=4639 RepID=A0AAV8P7X4_ENSVE|nr:hypothetical protein OPV22_024998 [Ensete ventricosum]
MEDMASEKKAKKGKKRKASDDDEKSDTMFDSTDPTVAEKQAAAANGSALKKPKLMKDDDGDTDNTADDPNALSNFTISKSLTNGVHKASRKSGYRRRRSVLVLLPTRELANQVYSDFEVYGGTVGLSSCCLYGGSPYRAQEFSLRHLSSLQDYKNAFLEDQ